MGDIALCPILASFSVQSPDVDHRCLSRKFVEPSWLQGNDRARAAQEEAGWGRGHVEDTGQ